MADRKKICHIRSTAYAYYLYGNSIPNGETFTETSSNPTSFSSINDNSPKWYRYKSQYYIKEGKQPRADILNFGEFAINYKANNEQVYFKNNENKIISFLPTSDLGAQGIVITNGEKKLKTSLFGNSKGKAVFVNSDGTSLEYKSLGSAAFTSSSSYATSGHNHDTVYSKLGHTHSYAGSASAGGAATSANKLNTNDGSSIKPVYFSNGIPVACSFTVETSVPKNAKFTDTTYSIGGDGTDTVKLYKNGGSTAQNSVTINNVAHATSADSAITASNANKLDDLDSTQFVKKLRTTNTATNLTTAVYSNYIAQGTDPGKVSGDVSIINLVLGGYEKPEYFFQRQIMTSIGGRLKTREVINRGEGAKFDEWETIAYKSDIIPYTLPNATTSEKGGVTIGDGINISGSKISVSCTSIGAATSGHNHDDVYSKLGHTHSYAGSASAGGAATSANKINTDAGSTTKPVYFNNGIPKECGFTVETSVPKNAVFTDHTYTLSSFGITATDAEINILDGVTATTAELNKLDGLTASTAELNYVDGVTSNIQTQLDGKSNNHTHPYLPLAGGTLTGNLSVHKSNAILNLNSNTAERDYASIYASDASASGTRNLSLQEKGGNVGIGTIAPTNKLEVVGTTSSTEFIENGTSLTDKYAPKSHNHYYAGSASIGGAATSANKLNTNDGSSIKPVYFSNGIPVACTHTIESDVPSGAKFTDTTYTLSSFGISATAAEINKLDGTSATVSDFNKLHDVTASATELNYVKGVTSNIQTQLSKKSDVGHTHSYLPLSGGTLSGNLTLMKSNQHNTDQFINFKYSTTDLDSYSWRLGYLGTGSGNDNAFTIQNNGSGKWADIMRLNLTDKNAKFTNNVSASSFTEDGTLLVNKYAPKSHTHSYAGSSNAGGAATSANKLNTDDGSSIKPVYFSNGIPVACDHTIESDVPKNAVFTDTKYSLSSFGITATKDEINKLDGTTATKTDFDKLHGVTASSTELNYVDGVTSNIQTQLNNKSNTGHGHVISDITNLQTTLNSKLNASLKGAKSGLAELDANGKVPSSQLPSYVDDVLEYDAKSKFPTTGETGKIYVDTSTNKSYRWGGTTYIIIASDLALGTTSSTAYRGDYGNAAYQHSIKTSGNPHHVTKTDVGLSNVENKSSATIRGELTSANIQKALGYIPPSTDTTYTISGNGTNTVTLNKNGATAQNSVTINNVAHATSADKLENTTDQGSSIKPVYFSGGVPKECGFTVETSVPKNAIFTDTKYSLSSFGITASSTEINYTKGVTSNIQTQLNGKAPNHTHPYVNETGDTMTGLLSAFGGIALNSTTSALSQPLFLVSMDAFDAGGKLHWSNASDVKVGNSAKLDGHTASYFSKEGHTHSYLPLAGGTVTGNLGVNKVERVGRQFNNLVTFENSSTVNEIVIKTKLPYTSSHMMPLIHIKGYAYGMQSPIELTIAFYIYDGYFCAMGATSTCPWKPKISLSSYVEGGKKYVAVNLEESIYFVRFQVDMFDAWSGSNRDYSQGWEVAVNAKDKTHPTIITTTDLVSVPYKSIANDISGNASSASKLTTSAGSSINPIYFSDGKPVACSYSIQSNVPSGAKFTDTIYTLPNATTSEKGGVTIGSGISLSGSKISVSCTSIGAATSGHKHDDVYSKLGHTHLYAGSSSAGGAATSANKINTDGGSSIKPVYFSGGVPKECGFTIETSVPKNAVFTDTKYSLGSFDITATAAEINKLDGVTATTSEINFLKGVTSNIQTQLNGKSNSHTHPYLPLAGGTLTGNLVIHKANAILNLSSTSADRDYASIYTTDASASGTRNLSLQEKGGNVGIGTITPANKLEVVGTTSSTEFIENGTSLVSKYAPKSHSHYYAGSASIGGAATSANKINTDAGTSKKPVYFSNGIPVACDHTIESDVPKNAVFTDTKYSLSSFGISATAAEINKLDGTSATVSDFNKLHDVTASATELNYVKGVTSNIQTQLNGKSNSHTHPYLPLAGGTVTGNINMMVANGHNSDQFISFKYSTTDLDSYSWRLGYLGTGSGNENAFVVQNNGSGKWADVMHLTLTDKNVKFASNVSAYSFTENGTLLTNKYAPKSHTHSYAGSSSAGGAATSANKINTDGGSATKPVYFSGGVPVACTYTLGQSVTSSSKLTDTTYTLSGSNATVTLTPSSGTAKSITIDNVAHATSASGCTGNSASASKLNTDGGSSIKPVYFSGGVPKECGFTVETSVPKNAVFTDTVYTLPTAASDKLGGVKIGSGINISGGVISATYTSVGAAKASHSHTISEITSLQSKLDGKSNTGHSHAISDITNLQNTLNSKLNTSLKGAKSGLAELDANGKVPASQLPSYVDDVLEYDAKSKFPTTGETGKIYVDTSTNKTYRWSGTQYTLIASDLALGTTSTTAYRGDYGNTAYQHSIKTSGNPHHVTKTDVGLGNVENLTAAQINAKITKANVTTALGYTPPTTNTNTTYTIGGSDTNTVKLYANGSSSPQNSVVINNVVHATNADNATNAVTCTGNAATASKLVNTVDVGSTSQPVYFVDGLPKTCGFTVLTSVPANAKFTDTKYSLGSFGITATASEINVLDGITATTAELNKLDGLTATTAELNYVDGVTSNIQTQLNGKSNSHTHPYLPLKGGTLTGLLTASGGIALDATTTSISKPQFLVSMDSFADGGKLHWTQSSDVTVGSATNATKLTTARTLWGQSFNGTANISGSLSNTGNITPSADLTYTLGTASLMYTKTFTRYIDTKSGYDLRLCAGGSEKLHIVAANGNVGIGNENPTEKLDVTGTAKAEKVNIKSKVTMEYNSTEECLEFVFV